MGGEGWKLFYTFNNNDPAASHPPDSFHSQRDSEDLYVIALGVCGGDKKARSTWIVTEGRSNENLPIRESDLHGPAGRCCSFTKKFAFLIARIAGKVSNKKQRFQVPHRDACSFSVGVLGGEIWICSLFGKKFRVNPLTSLPLRYLATTFIIPVSITPPAFKTSTQKI